MGGREVGVSTHFSLLEVLKQVCLCVREKIYKAHINVGRCVLFFEEGENTWENEEKKNQWELQEVFLFFSHID